MTTIGSVNVGVATTRTASSLGHGPGHGLVYGGHGHGYGGYGHQGPEGGMGGVGENAMDIEVDVGDEPLSARFNRGQIKSRKEMEMEMEEEAAFRAVEMSMGIGLGGVVDGIRVDVEKMSDAI